MYVRAPTTWVGRFKVDGNLAYHEEGVEELERNCKVLQTAACYDQLMASNLACLELVSRAMQTTAYSCRSHFARAREDSFERNLMYGSVLGDTNVPLCPFLCEHVALEMGMRNALDKERRKAQEIWSALGAEPTDGGGRGRGRGGRGQKGKESE